MHIPEFFCDVILYQKTLFIKSCSFRQGLNGIIRKEHETLIENQQITIKNEIFNETLSVDYYENKAFSIVDCSFLNIQEYAILIKCHASFYITTSFFCNCSTREGVIVLRIPRCPTITHVCSTECKSEHRNSFLFCDCHTFDFINVLYNTIIGQTSEYGRDAYCFHINFGKQTIKCNNLTNIYENGFLFDNPFHFLFALNTIFECAYSCLQLSGRFETNISFMIKNVNMYSKGYDGVPIFHLFSSSQLYQNIYIEYSVLLTASHSFIYLENFNFSVFIDNCIINSDFNDNEYTNVQLNNCMRVEYDTKYLAILPHYTYGEYCIGPTVDSDKNAYGCNVGKCLDDECNQTIGFPEDVVPYTTVIHSDIQTLTFTPSKLFTNSNDFSNSIAFSETEKFSKSTEFSDSSYFTFTFVFSFSHYFSKSFPFSFSDYFSQTLIFSNTFHFTISNEFTESSDFSKSSSFLQSDFFTKSSFFSLTNAFTETALFSLSNQFSSTNEFSKSFPFALYSIFFTNSESFSSSKSLLWETTFPTPSQSMNNNNRITFFQSLIESYVSMKTVTFTSTYSFLITLYQCKNEAGEIIFCEEQSYTLRFLPYIIYSISRTYIATHFSIETKINKKRVTQEQLIGIVCGAVAIFFSIVGIVIIAIQKKNRNAKMSEFDEIFSSENESDDTIKETNTVETIPTNSNIQFDDWL